MADLFVSETSDVTGALEGLWPQSVVAEATAPEHGSTYCVPCVGCGTHLCVTVTGPAEDSLATFDETCATCDIRDNG